MQKSFSKYVPWFFIATAFESLFAISALLFIPTEGGLSLARLSLLLILFAFFVAGIFLGFYSRSSKFELHFAAPTRYILSFALLSLISGLVLFLLRYLNPEKLLPYYERLSPLFWYLFVLGIQVAIFLLFIKNGFHPQALSKLKPVYSSAIAVFCILIFILLFVSITKLGITPDTGYWGEPGVAMMGWQFILAILAGFSILIYTASYKTLTPRNAQVHAFSFQFVIPLLLYLTACILWLGVPLSVLQNSFYAPFAFPANMPFPYSDAGFYDYLSQSLLIGANYLGGIPPRPLYVLFLAILHFFFGQNYPAMITAQTLVLALFPVALYFLAKKLHTPAAGVTVALFAIFRELIGLTISSSTRVANSKIFTTDFPTAMGLAFLCLVFIWWLERRDLKSTLVAGGFFGLVLLFRTQSLLVLPVIFILAWFAYQRKTKQWIIAGIIFAISMIFAVLPWLIHNRIVSGHFTFDDPRQSAIIYSQYSFSGNLDLSQFDPAKESVGHRILSFTFENPAYVASFITNHFLNTEIGGLLALPLIKDFNGLFAPVNLYWVAWNGTLEWFNLGLMIVYLAIIAMGFGAVWRRIGWVGLLPLAINLGYALANGIARFSSWRYNLPVDWIFYFYFSIGIIEILANIAILLGADPEKIFPEHVLPEPKSIRLQDFRLQYSLIILGFLFIGASPWLAKELTHPRYTATQDELIVRLASDGYDGDEIRNFLSQPQAILLEGRLLYPHLFRRNEGMVSAHPWPAYEIRDYSRISSILINNSRYDLIFITKEILNFTQGADVIILACQRDDYLEVRLIDFGVQTFQSAPLSQSCR